MVGLPRLLSHCAKLHIAGGHGQLSQVFSGEVYDCYSVSPEYFVHCSISKIGKIIKLFCGSCLQLLGTPDPDNEGTMLF
jgi:hypothetical protein